MARETYDWSTDYSDEQSAGTSTYTSGSGDTVEITVSQPDPGGDYTQNGSGFETRMQGGTTDGHFVMEVNHSNNTDTVSTTIDFRNNSATASDSVTDPSFTLLDLDSPSNAGYQDQVTILAYDASGNLLPVTLTPVNSSVVSVSGSTATAILGAGSGGSMGGNVMDSSTEGNVAVSISGDVSQIVIVYSNGSLADSNPIQQQIGFGDLSFDLQPTAICFARGSRILTAEREVAVEDLKIGDMIATADHGLCPLRWVGKRSISGRGRLAPVRFETNAIGNKRPLLLSPQHRIVLSGWKAEYYAGASEVLATAKHLINGKDIRQVEVDEIEYHHLMFDRHEVIFAEGAACESLFVSEMSLKGMGPEGRSEIETLFPGITNNPNRFGSTARLCLRNYETRFVA